MSARFDQTNNSGIVTTTGGNMPTNIHSNQYQPTSRGNGQGGAGGKASIVVVSNSHAVEVAGDGGLWDTVSGAAVQDYLTNILCIGT